MNNLSRLLRAARAAEGCPAYFPVRLHALPEATSWVSGGRLTPAALAAARKGVVMTVKRSPDRQFMYTESGVPDRLPTSATEVGARTEFLDMDPTEFVRACELQDGTTPPFHYYTCGVKLHAPSFDEQACPGWQRLVVDESAAAHRHSTPAHSSMWVGGKGSTTQAHYDVLNNIFVQVYGRKRFRLWGPQAHAMLRVFPDAHPRARKARVLVDGCSTVLAPEVDVTLEAGQALFIPAFWFHHVEALSCSVSVNVFSENAMKLAAQDILARPPPESLRVQAPAPGTPPNADAAAQRMRSIAGALLERINLSPSLLATVASRYQPPQPPTPAEVREYSEDAAAERGKVLDERLTHTRRESPPPPERDR